MNDTSPEQDPCESEEYQQFVAECAEHCECTHGVCAGVLAGGLCDRIIEDDEEDDFYRRELAPDDND